MPERHSLHALTHSIRRALSATPARHRERASLSGGGRALHLVSAMALLFGLLLQVSQYSQSLAAPLSQSAPHTTWQGQTDVVPAPVQVVVLGDFQQDLGCNANDFNCPTTQLNNQNGLWTGFIPLAPGNYQYQLGIQAADQSQYAFGQRGLNSNPFEITVNDGDAGVFFSFNANTYETSAEAQDAQYQLNTDFGTFALGPDRNGLSTIIDAPRDGSLNLQLLVNGQPASNPQSVDLRQGPNRITISPDGQNVDVENLGYATLTIQRSQQDQPAPGGCYQVIDRNDLLSQGCDIDDGQPDGITTISFAEGIDPGNYTIREIIAPDGADQADDQDVDLQEGDNTLQIQTGGGQVPNDGTDDSSAGDTGNEEFPTEETTPEERQQGGPGDLIVSLLDGDNQPVGFACFQLLDADGNVVAESCDTSETGDSNPGNGNTGFFGVPAGTYTLHQSETPEGSEPIEDQQVEVIEGQSNNIAFNTTVASPEAETGDLVVLRQDQDGNPVGGSCFIVYDNNGNQLGEETCDEDGDNPDDGRTGFFDLPADQPLNLRETRTPDTVEPAQDQQFQLQAGQATDVEVRTNRIEAAAETGTAVIVRTDNDGNPAGGGCYLIYDADGNLIANETCDDDGDGQVEFPDLPADTTLYVRETRTPENVESIDDQQFDVSANESSDVELSSDSTRPEEPPTEEPTATEEEAQTGSAVIVRMDNDGNFAGGGCYLIYDASGNQISDEICDDDGDGQVEFDNLPADTSLYVRETRTPDTVQPIDDQEFSVSSGESSDVDLRSSATQQEEPTATEAEPTATEEQAQTGSAVIVRMDNDGNFAGGGCYLIYGADGNLLADETCDDDGDGQVQFDNLPADTTLYVRETRTPDTVQPIDDQEFSISGGESSEVDLQSPATQQEEPTATEEEPTPTEEEVPPTEEPTPTEEGQTSDQPASGPPGDLIVTLHDDNDNPIGGACFQLVNPDGSVAFESCDVNDDFPNNGNTGFFGVPSGNYSLHQSTTPDGSEPLEDQPVTVDPGQSRTDIVTTSLTAGEPTATEAEPTATEQVEPTATEEEANPEPTATTEEQGPSGIVRIDVSALETNGQDVCVELNTGGSIGISNPPTACDNGNGDDNNDQGIIDLTDVSPGAYVVIVTQGSDDALNTEPLPITVADDGSGTATLTEAAPQTGSVTIVAVDSDANPIPGPCFSLSGDNGDFGPLCDDGSNGDTEGDGQVTFNDLPVGTYAVSETTIPDGYQQNETVAPITADIAAGQNDPVQVAHRQSTGSISIVAVDADGNPIPGPCFSLASDNDEFGPICDDDQNGSTPDDGAVDFTDLPVGTYTVSETTIPDGYNPIQTVAPLTVDVAAGQNDPFTIEHFQLTGSLQVSLTVGDQLLDVEGACITLSGRDGEICDNSNDDADNTTGTILIENLPFGDYTITVSSGPDGYVIPELAGQATIDSVDTPATVSMPLALAGPESGTLTISVVDDTSGDPIDAGCFDVTNDDGTFNFCDDDADGTISVPDVTFGHQTITQTDAADGYQPDPSSQEVDLSRDAPEATLEFRNTVGTNAIGVTLIEQNDNPQNPIQAEGGCVTIDELDREICDNGDGDDNSSTGLIRIGGIPFGEYTLRGSAAPDGYELIDESVPVTVEASTEPAQVAVSFAPAAPEPGSVAIVAVDADGTTIPGACFSLSGDAGEAGPLCDDGSNGDTASDGQVTFSDLAPGTYTITETTIPDGYQPDETVAPITVDIVSGENDPVQVAHHLAAVSVTVSATNDSNESLAGACYTLDGGEALCDEDGDGIVTFDNVTPGEHRFEQTTPPDGYQPVDGQTVTIVPGEVESVTFSNTTPVNGSLLIVVTNPDGTPLGQTCATIAEGLTICDGLSGDASPTTGQILVNDLAPGDYSVSLSALPETVSQPDAQNTTVQGGEQATVTFNLEAAPEETGTVEVELQDSEGSVPEEGCVLLSNSAAGQQLGPFCDNGEGDTNNEAGKLTIADVPTGTWLVSDVTAAQTESGQGGEAQFAAQSFNNSRTIQVQANIVVVVIIIVIIQPVEGSIQITTQDANTHSRIGDACYDLKRNNQTTEICDGDAEDGNGLSGVILVSELRTGTYTITLSNEIDGYEQQHVPSANVMPAYTVPVIVSLVPVAQTGIVVVNKTDNDGKELGNSCFALKQAGITRFQQCDNNDGKRNDGQLIFNDVPTGSYRLVETRTPSSDYQAAPDRTINVIGGKQTTITVKNTPRTADVVIRKVDASNTSTLLAGACFSLRNGDNDIVYGSFCDSDDLASDGTTRFNDVAAGTYILVEDVVPYGYKQANAFEITVKAGATQIFTVKNQKLPPPPTTGTLVISKTDNNGKWLGSSCFRLYDGNNPLTNTVCDASDGKTDGKITMTKVPTGTWTLVETVTPSDAYSAGDNQQVKITTNKTTSVTVVNSLKTGRIKIIKTNTSGAPLQNACFDLLEDNAGAKCTTASGEVSFDNLTVGTYTIRETQAPYGYQSVQDKSGVKVYAGKTNVVTIVNHRIPPAPTTGSVQVLKFYCPAGDAGERTSFLGGTAGNAELAKTAGCEQGNAAFNLDQDDGNGGPGDFTTGKDGQYQVSVVAGTYTLTETDPDLKGSSSVKLKVYKNQLTTVIVINYLEPPKPDPITVNITKWTCTPSFNGTLYDDFAQNCTANTQLTNSITFRMEGPISQKHVTGDGGKVGQTTFTDLTPGTYTLKEEQPFDIPTSYGFCGTDSSWPADTKIINGSFSLDLDYGDTLTCKFFNIPEDVSTTTGVVLVRKFVCNIEKAPKGYDWASECTLSSQNAKFALNSYNTKTQQFQEFSQGTANDDGFLRFTKLQPGTYELKEVGSTWCHAESDNVDAKGNVVVKAGKVSTVWIYNCVPTKNPPNTGSGDAAALLDPSNVPPSSDGGTDGSDDRRTPTAAIILPLIALGSRFAQKRRKAA